MFYMYCQDLVPPLFYGQLQFAHSVRSNTSQPCVDPSLSCGRTAGMLFCHDRYHPSIYLPVCLHLRVFTGVNVCTVDKGPRCCS